MMRSIKCTRLFNLLRLPNMSSIQQPIKRYIPYMAKKDNKATLYVHWPYCAKLCPYCNFNKYVREHIDHTRMRKCLVKETGTLIQMSEVTEIKSIFFGGGTPSLAEPETIAAILNTVRDNVLLANDAEVTLEANPTSTEMTKLGEFKDAGINRVSVGVQSLCEDDLKFLGRQHSVDEAIRCVLNSKSLFPGNVSLDIMFGRPNQTVATWKKELQQILTVTDKHISLYQLTVKRGTPLYKMVQDGSVVLPDEDVMADLYETVIEIFDTEGFVQYEVSNFAKDGMIGRHNKAYWEGEQYIGVGPGSHGRFIPYMLGKHQREARVQTADPDSWMVEVEKNGHGTRLARQQTPLEELEEFLIMGLRTKDGISNKNWTRKCKSQSMTDIFCDDAVTQYIKSGLISMDASGMRTSKEGLKVLDSILPDLLNVLHKRWTDG